METKDLKQLENEYDVDKSKFYGNISSRIKNKSVGKNVLEVDGKLIDDEDELLTVWEQHYVNLYTAEDQPKFKNTFKCFVENKLVEYAQDSHQNDDPLDEAFLVEEVTAVCRKLPLKWKGGWFK